MKPIRIPLALVAISTCLLLPSQMQAASQSAVSSKLDKRLAPIVEASEQHVESSLMQRALIRQNAHSNTPFEARWNASGQVQVYLHYNPAVGAPDSTGLKELGATDIKQSPELKVIQAWVPASALTAVADLPGVSRVSVPRYAVHKRAPALGPVTAKGSTDTEGDTILGSAGFRSATGITGQGISVGVISDGDEHIALSQKTGDLPAKIVNDPNDTGSFHSSGDEGTAMMEIVYDIAPGVKQLGFCGPATTADFITCLDDFAANIHANVIVDDLGFPGGPMFSDDDFATAVKNFSTAHPNIRLVAATGNDGLGFWQGTWQPMASNTSAPVNGVTYPQAQNFDTTGTNPTPYLTVTVPGGDSIAYMLEWNDPWDDTNPPPPNDPNDYDVVVFDNNTGDSSGNTAHPPLAGHLAVACNQGINISAGTLCNQDNSKNPTNTPGPFPIQGSSWTASQTTYYLEVFQKNGTPGTNLKILVFDATSPVPVQVSPSTPGSVYGHAALAFPTEISVGAINAAQALTGTYSIEQFSSLGPVEFGVTDGTSTTVVNPQSIQKPDFAAPDCVSVTGAGGFDPTFCGTSAAAPHIAGLVALLMAGYPNQSPYTLLQTAATQPGSPNPNGTFGFGVPVMLNLLSAGLYPVPAANISAPVDGIKVNTGQKVGFKSGCLVDSAVTGLKQDWNFGAGSGVPDSTQADTSVAFSKAGTYTVSLTCTASSGSSTTSISVTVDAPSKGGGSLDLLSLLALGLLVVFADRRKSGLSARLH